MIWARTLRSVEWLLVFAKQPPRFGIHFCDAQNFPGLDLTTHIGLRLAMVGIVRLMFGSVAIFHWHGCGCTVDHKTGTLNGC
jgi:hypothetical protein